MHSFLAEKQTAEKRSCEKENRVILYEVSDCKHLKAWLSIQTRFSKRDGCQKEDNIMSGDALRSFDHDLFVNYTSLISVLDFTCCCPALSLFRHSSNRLLSS